jgi:hypothetical protein
VQVKYGVIDPPYVPEVLEGIAAGTRCHLGHVERQRIEHDQRDDKVKERGGSIGLDVGSYAGEQRRMPSCFWLFREITIKDRENYGQYLL